MPVTLSCPLGLQDILSSQLCSDSLPRQHRCTAVTQRCEYLPPPTAQDFQIPIRENSLRPQLPWNSLQTRLEDAPPFSFHFQVIPIPTPEFTSPQTRNGTQRVSFRPRGLPQVFPACFRQSTNWSPSGGIPASADGLPSQPSVSSFPPLGLTNCLPQPSVSVSTGSSMFRLT